MPYLLEVNIIGQLHVLGVDLENLKSAGSIWNANVYLSVKATWD